MKNAAKTQRPLHEVERELILSSVWELGVDDLDRLQKCGFSARRHQEMLDNLLEGHERPNDLHRLSGFLTDSASGVTRIIALFAVLMWAWVAWSYSPWYPLPGYPEDVMVVALTATVVAVVVAAWSFSGFTARWDEQQARPKHRRPLN